jgi:hypothetical protein
MLNSMPIAPCVRWGKNQDRRDDILNINELAKLANYIHSLVKITGRILHSSRYCTPLLLFTNYLPPFSMLTFFVNFCQSCELPGSSFLP